MNAANPATDISPSEVAASRPVRSASSLVLGGVLGSLVALVAVLGTLWLRSPGRLPELTPRSLAEANQRWDEHGPANYRLALRLGGRQPGQIEIEVREGRVTRFTRDGVTPRQQRTWDYWTVPNQLSTIEQDLDSAQDPARGFGAPPGSRVVQRAEFDAQLGYPRRYQRYVLGTPLEVEWEITHFEPLDGPGTAAAAPAGASQ